MSKNGIRQFINNSKYPKPEILAYIKGEINPKNYKSTISSFPILKQIKLKNNSFDSIEKIKDRPTYFFTANIEKELYWTLIDITQNVDSINQFIEKKSEFEKYYLLNNYDRATSCLIEIQEKYGFNLWTIQMSLLLKENVFETKDNWSLLSDYLSKINSPIYKFTTNFYSKRIEKNLSFRSILNQFINEFSSIHAEDRMKDFLISINFYMAYYDYSHADLSSVLHLGSKLTYIDLYLLLIESLLKIVSYSTQNDKIILEYIKQLYPNIKDQRILNLLNLLDDNTNSLYKLDGSQEILDLIDKYTNGNYEECYNKCLDQLNERPNCFELYELYIKSTIALNKDFVKTNISQNIDNILEMLYHSLSYDKDAEKSFNNILKTCISFMSFDFAKQLNGFVRSFNGDYEVPFMSIGYLSSTINNPRLLAHSLTRKESVYRKYTERYDSLALQVNWTMSGDYDGDFNLNLANKVQEKVYEIKFYFHNKKNYNKVLELLETFPKEKSPSYYNADLLAIQFHSFIKNQQLLEAIKLAVNTYFLEPNYYNLLNIDLLEEELANADIVDYSACIETPILYSFFTKDYNLFVAYDEYMSFLNIDKPSGIDIDTMITENSHAKVVYFLSKVCSVSTMKYSLYFENANEVEQERISICEMLKGKDIDNQNLYEDEILNIIKNDAVRKVIKEVDNSRLFVNVNSLKDMYLDNIKESFLRYKKIEDVSSDRELIGFNSTKEGIWTIDDLSQEDKIDYRYDNPAFLAFKSIFQELRDKFLYSKEYGLDSCLSTRIRHGALRNHIRSVFEKLNLITAKTEDVYIDNDYWLEYIHTSETTYNLIQQKLKDFSKEIDDLTDYIVDRLIQIRTEKNIDKKEGLFNYTFDDSVLYIVFEELKKQFTSPENAVDVILGQFQLFTSIFVSPNIKEFFVTILKNRFLVLIENLQVGIRCMDINHSNELLNALSKASTEIQIELSKIADWFDLRTVDSSSILDIETVVEASKEYTNRINPNHHLNLEVQYEATEKILTSINLIFVLNILLNNVIRHSKLNPDEINVSLKIIQQNEDVEIRCTNNLADSVILEDIKQRLQLVKDNWQNRDNIERSNSEGRSGFDKIKRIFIYEMDLPTNKFEYLITDRNVSISLFLPFLINQSHENINN